MYSEVKKTAKNKRLDANSTLTYRQDGENGGNMYTVYRFYYKYGREDDPIECTTKEFDSFEKALKYGKRYAKGIRFNSFEIRDELDLIYEEFADGTFSDFRKK